METLLSVIENREWGRICEDYRPEEIAAKVSFKQAMFIAYSMLHNEKRDDELREYAVKLIEAIQTTHIKEWSADWKNEIFLADAYYFIMQQERRFEICKRVYENFKSRLIPLPPPILVSFAGCLLNQEPLTLEDIQEAKILLQGALKQERSVEAALLMRTISREENDNDKFELWNKSLHELEDKGSYMKDKWPAFFNE